MKFHIGLVTALCLLAGTLSAQNLTFGVKGGLNVYSIANDNDVKYDSKMGYHIGMLLHIHVAQHFAVQPELLYSTQGAKDNSILGDVTLKLGYANVPVMLQYMFDNGFRIEAGPQIGFLAKADSELNGSDSDIKDDLKTIDFTVGVGIGYINPPTGFGIDARYNYGLSDINENGPVKSYNRGFQIGLVYQFQRYDY